MKKSNFNPRNQYYNTASRSRYSSRSSRRLQSQYGGSVASSSRNVQFQSNQRFYHRLQKACTTFSSNDVSKEVFLYRKQIQKLEKEGLKKDKIIFELKQSNNHNRQIESQLVQVYRVLYMYQGKISEYEKQLKKLELAISSQVPKDITNQVEQLLESYRVENSELGAQLEERNRQIMDLETKMKKLENKYFNTVWKLSSTKREIANPLKKRFPNLRNTITINETPLLEKQKALKFKSRNKNISSQNEYQIINEPASKESETMLNFKKVQTSPQYNLKQSISNDNFKDYRNSNSATSTPANLFGNSNANNIINNNNKALTSGTMTPQTQQQSGNVQYFQRSVTPEKQLQTITNQQKSQSNSSYTRYIGGNLQQGINQGPSQQSPSSYNSTKIQSNYLTEAQQQPYRIASQQYGIQSSSQQSNPNLNSQMTISNANNRRVQYKDIIRSESPRRQFTSSMTNSQQRYAIGVPRDLTDVNNQVKQVEKRISYIPGNTSPNGRSVYLG